MKSICSTRCSITKTWRTNCNLSEQESNILKPSISSGPPSHCNGDRGRFWVQQKRSGWTWSLCCGVQRKTQEGNGTSTVFSHFFCRKERECSFFKSGSVTASNPVLQQNMWVVAYLQSGSISPFHAQTQILCDEMCRYFFFFCDFSIISSATQLEKNVFMVWFIHKMDESGSSEWLADVLREEGGWGAVLPSSF